MAIFTIPELFDLAVMILAVGFIFKDYFVSPVKKNYDPLVDHWKNVDFDRLKFSIAVTAPAIAFHEMGHKFASLAVGIPATFHADYIWLGIGIVLKLVNFPFLFFVPGFVSYTGGLPWQNAIVAFAGPCVNLVLWLGSYFMLKNGILKKYSPYLFLTQQINMFLFIFNMIPIPPFDGYSVFTNVLQMTTGSGF